MAALFFLFAGLLAAIAIRWPSPLLRTLALLPALLWLSIIVSLVIDHWTDQTQDAVIVVDETIARAADSDNAPARFANPLPEGTEISVLEMRDRWAQIALADGQDAWIKSTALALIEQHY